MLKYEDDEILSWRYIQIFENFSNNYLKHTLSYFFFSSDCWKSMYFYLIEGCIQGSIFYYP